MIYDMILYDMIYVIYDMIWYDIIWYDMIYDMIWYDMIYLLTAVRLTPGGSSISTYLQTNNTQNNTIKQNTQNETHITIKIHKHNNKNT
jgi:hypothetical protein